MRTQATLEPIAHRPRSGRIPMSVRTLAERSSPTEIRLDIQKLMGQEQMELAQALGDAGLALYPQHEEMLAINALLAVARGDWVEGRDLLVQLQGVQGSAAPATTWWLMARCERCLGEPATARDLLERGLRLHPSSTELQTELSLLLQESRG